MLVLDNIATVKSGSVKHPLVSESWIFPLIQVYKYENELSQNKNTTQSFNNLKNQLLVLRHTFKWYNFSLLSKYKFSLVDILILSRSSARRYIRGEYFDIFTDYLPELLPGKTMFKLELPNLQIDHYRRINNKIDTYYLAGDTQLLHLQAKLTNSILLNGLAHTKNEYLVNIDHTFRRRIYKFNLFFNYFHKWIVRLRPKCVIIIDSYSVSGFALTYAAKYYGIPVIELQHGLLHPEHPGYIYHHGVNRKLFPDYYFSYGEYSTQLLIKQSDMFDKTKIKTVGFYHLTQLDHTSSHKAIDVLRKWIGNDEVVLVTSQATVHERLMNFLNDKTVTRLQGVKIVVKLHPGQIKAGASVFEYLNQNICVVAEPELSLNDLIGISKIHITVYSTSFMQALYNGLPSIFLDIKPYTKKILDHIDNQSTFLAGSGEVLRIQIKKILENYPVFQARAFKKASWYYEKNPGKRLSEELGKIIGA